MRPIFICYLFVLSVSYGQNTTRYFQKDSKIIELTDVVERFYEREYKTSNEFPFQTYVLKEERNLATEAFVDPFAGKKKERYKEISVTAAKEILLDGYISDYKRYIAIKLSEKFDYFHRYYTKSYYFAAVSNVCSNFELDSSNNDIILQRNAIDTFYKKELDSLVLVHERYNTLVTNYFANNPSPTYDSTKLLLDKLPTLESQKGSYVAAVLNFVVKQDPEQFYAYLETVQEPYPSYFMLPDAQGMQKVKQSKSDSPIRKELIQFRRKQSWINAGVITAVGIVDAGIIVGIVYLFSLI